MARTRSNTGGSANIWPGFVDALATLLLVIIFLLVVFVLAQVLLSQAISGKDEALDRLTRQINELAQMLDLERQANADLRLNIAQLSASLQESAAARDELSEKLASANARADAAEGLLASARASLGDSAEKAKGYLLEIESLKRDIEALRQVREDLENQVGELSSKLSARDREIGSLRDRSKELTASLADARERTLLAQKEIEKREIRLSEVYDLYAALEEESEKERKLSAQQKSQISLLNQQIIALRQELARLNTALEAAEAKEVESQATIKDLGARLNRALASKVQELSRYRSEFFGRLREVLGDRPGIQIVGDRFVFQSEVLFGSGSAELGLAGKEQMSHLAASLIRISREIPSDLNWVLRVDGHTDHVPIKTSQFPSNWELSSARAISVVKFLIANGVSAQRLVAAGFGEFQPLDDRRDEIGRRRNRRIELKLTQR
jgi:chemotaxis protein MotB